ncbi:hypothetical protein BV25DRAFT_1840932 [Artomyces pyxidatus]|uniref:Uncharacterized protein n=1 Tax=Artomyces pyxidatus TaxID=48021 RepID=A0ACB8SS55_9AGAM|nr:hypothetical protein BV25DRAFT_1840932 [Artomyces pyxidatus]
MKLYLTTLLASIVAAVSAQNIAIGSPADGSALTPGTNLTVQVTRAVRSRPSITPHVSRGTSQNSLTGSQEVSIVISVLPCPAGGCADPAERLGATLYSGGFAPRYPAARTPQDVPQQNFTVAVPAGLPQGRVALSVAHLALVGAGLSAVI